MIAFLIHKTPCLHHYLKNSQSMEGRSFHVESRNLDKTRIASETLKGVVAFS